MFSIITSFLKGNMMRIGIGLLVTAVISGGSWFVNNKITNLQNELRQQIEVSAVVTNEYEHSLQLLDSQKREFAIFRRDMRFLDSILQEKNAEDARVAKEIMKIRGGMHEVISEKDGDVSDILTDTLDGIRLLRESTTSGKHSESSGDHKVSEDGDTN